MSGLCDCVCPLVHRLVGPVVKASVSNASLALWVRRRYREHHIKGSNPACDVIFSGSSHTSDLKKLVLQWLPCQARGVLGSAL